MNPSFIVSFVVNLAHAWRGLQAGFRRAFNHLKNYGVTCEEEAALLVKET
ncbi:MAG: hypothetical protein AVDCRST_MAG91-927 [uncultured Sphingomonadaceae bacterium]|uniref:Uncharacterized protein n=1 Tax=uncultured Sphingomonadaceae bacterium TaxID=169976 RepID=A0A6J4SNP8_9SPHN|nr:MAG: hypothetical protein AVDCRST_MAG91-927 [uncultured Sphingomonadaceae bacterium]